MNYLKTNAILKVTFYNIRFTNIKILWNNVLIVESTWRVKNFWKNKYKWKYFNDWKKNLKSNIFNKIYYYVVVLPLLLLRT